MRTTNASRSWDERSIQCTSSTINSTGWLSASPARTRRIASNNCSRPPAEPVPVPKAGHRAASAERSGVSSGTELAGSSTTSRAPRSLVRRPAHPRPTARTSPTTQACPAREAAARARTPGCSCRFQPHPRPARPSPAFRRTRQKSLEYIKLLHAPDEPRRRDSTHHQQATITSSRTSLAESGFPLCAPAVPNPTRQDGRSKNALDQRTADGGDRSAHGSRAAPSAAMHPTARTTADRSTDRGPASLAPAGARERPSPVMTTTSLIGRTVARLRVEIGRAYRTAGALRRSPTASGTSVSFSSSAHSRARIATSSAMGL